MVPLPALPALARAPSSVVTSGCTVLKTVISITKCRDDGYLPANCFGGR
jgi:hypothetical protein